MYQKDTASRLRAQLRRKAISLYYNNTEGQQMTYEDVAKKMQLPPRYIEKWITRYESTGLHGYVGQRQSAILCIYKKNPNITLTQLRILLKKVGIILSTNELRQILKNLKHILTDPMFKSASEEQVLRKLSKVTKVQAKSVIKMNQKMSLEKEKINSGMEQACNQLSKTIYLDHNYVSHPDLSYDENDYSLYDNIDKIAKYKTDLMNKIATVSKNLDKFFESPDSTDPEVEEIDNIEVKKYKISLLREQVLYLCLEMKGPKLSIKDVTQNLPLSEAIVSKWIEQAKSIKRYVHAKHVNKCCGKIQESIVRLVKLNSKLKTEEIKNILHNISIDLSNLKLERQLNSVRYMINGPEDFTEKENEDLALSKDDIDYCIKCLSLKINSLNTNKPKRQKLNDIEKSSPKQLSLQNIIESYNTGKIKNLPPKNTLNDHVYQHSSCNDNIEDKVKIAREKLHKELANVISEREKKEQGCKKPNESEFLNFENIDIQANNTYNGQMNGLNLLQAVTLNEMAIYGLTNKTNNKKAPAVLVEYNETASELNNSKMKTAEFNEDVNLLQYISMTPNNFAIQNVRNFNNQESTKQSEVVEETVYNINLVEQNSVVDNAALEKNTLSLASQKGVFDSQQDEQAHESLTNMNICSIINEGLIPPEIVRQLEGIIDEQTISSIPLIFEDNEIISCNSQENKIDLENQNVEAKTVDIVTDCSEISDNVENELKLNTFIVENTSEEIEEESGIGSLILDGKTQEEERDINTYENIINNTSASSDEYNSYKERKRKYSENDDSFESEESEFEPIDDVSFAELDSDSDSLVKEETDDSEKEIMTEYIECEDNSVVIKYWLAT